MTASDLAAQNRAFGAPIRDGSGRIRYIIDVREAALAGYPASSPPKDGFPEYLKPQTRHLAAAMALQYGFVPRALTSWIGTTITTYLTEEQAARLQGDARVASLFPDRRVELSSSLWQDNGRYSWGVVATGAATVLPNSVIIYILDTGVGLHQDLPSVSRAAAFPTANPIGCNPHSTHVAGIIGAVGQTTPPVAGSLGVIAGTPIVSVGIGWENTIGLPCAPTSDDAAVSGYLSGLEYIRAHILATGKVGVVNISANLQDFKTIFPLGAKLAQVATPNGLYRGAFIAQSAGNGVSATGNACGVTYDAQLVDDGVMIVGAIDANGQQVVPLAGIPGMRGPFQASLAGSNYGQCVDVWAPGKDIASTWKANQSSPPSAADQHAVLSGTSMAAPHLTAVAAYLANFWGLTTPSQIEAWVRAYMFSLGSTAQDGRPILTANLSGVRPTAIPSPLFALNSDTKNVVIPAAQPFTLRYDSIGASSCSISAQINGVPWYSVPNFQPAYDWGTVQLGSGSYRWSVDCVSTAGYHNTASIQADVVPTPSPTVTFYVDNVSQPNGGTYVYPYSTNGHAPVNFRYSSSLESDCDLVTQSGPIGGPLSPWYSYAHLGIVFDWGAVVWTPGDYQYTISCYGGNYGNVSTTVNIASR